MPVWRGATGAVARTAGLNGVSENTEMATGSAHHLHWAATEVRRRRRLTRYQLAWGRHIRYYECERAPSTVSDTNTVMKPQWIQDTPVNRMGSASCANHAALALCSSRPVSPHSLCGERPMIHRGLIRGHRIHPILYILGDLLPRLPPSHAIQAFPAEPTSQERHSKAQRHERRPETEEGGACSRASAGSLELSVRSEWDGAGGGFRVVLRQERLGGLGVTV
jgi:hypothetical protein